MKWDLLFMILLAACIGCVGIGALSILGMYLYQTSSIAGALLGLGAFIALIIWGYVSSRNGRGSSVKAAAEVSMPSFFQNVVFNSISIASFLGSGLVGFLILYGVVNWIFE